MKIVSSKLAILGAGGHSKVIHDIATKNNYTKISFLTIRILQNTLKEVLIYY